MNDSKLVIGLTGLYCSGKSTVEKILKNDFGFFIIDVDKIGHWALEEKKNNLINIFGNNILTDNKIDRKKLGQIVFNNKKDLQQLNSIVHPAMVKKIEEIIKETKEARICINAALLFEMGLNKLCQKILITKISFFQILKRAKKRDNSSFLRILKIISSQKVLKFAKKNSENAEIFYVSNNSDSFHLSRKVKEILNKICPTFLA
jgi:dephospho-CoA kinase